MQPAVDRERIGVVRQAGHYLSLYGALCQNSIVRDMQFKANFLLWIVVEWMWFALQLAFIAVLYSHTDRIATWSRWEVVLLTGASQVIQMTFQALFFTNIVNLSDHVRTGRLDFMLLLPVNTRFLVSFRTFDPGSLVGVLTGFSVMGFACMKLGLLPGPGQCACFLLLCAAGVLIHYSLMFGLSSLSFLFMRAQGIVWGYYNFFHIARLPDAAFGGAFRACFTYVIPMLLVTNVPVKFLADKFDHPLEFLPLLGMSALCFWASHLFWSWALSRYTSASS